jgi:hypothetical protein
MNDLRLPSPVFVVSPVRSGSTLLRLMLDSHPRISNPGECDFLFDMVTDDGTPPDVGAYVEWLSANRIFQAKRIVVAPAQTYAELMQSFLAQLRREGAALTMNVHRHFHRIPRVFPDARYIRLLRDPRDVARSCIGMGWVGHVYYGVDIWIEAERSWQELRTRLAPGQYMEIRYEHLMSDVESGLAAICGFLGVEYSDRMTSYTSRSPYAPPDKRLSYQWKTRYTRRELQLVEGKLGPALSALGYEPSGHDPTCPGFWERFQLYLAHKKHRAAFQIKRYGLSLYIRSALASRFGPNAWRYACCRKKNEIDIRYLKEREELRGQDGLSGQEGLRGQSCSVSTL